MNLSRSAFAIAPALGALLLVASVVACSSDDTGTAAGADAATPVADGGTTADSAAPEAGTDSSTPPDAATDAGSCNTVVNGAAVVGEVAGVGATPAGAGGTIVDGTYFLTKHEVYLPDTPDANSRRRTAVIAGNSLMIVQNDTGKPEERIAATFVAAASNLALTVTCPAAASVAIPYTATPTTFTLHDKNDIFTYTKQ